MATLKNAVEKAEKVKINEYYDVSGSNIMEIIEAYPNDPFLMCHAAFGLGYLQGSKAERSALKKESK